jgi:CBS domain-containing protein
MHVEKLNPMTAARLTTIGEGSTVRAAALSLSEPGVGMVVVCSGNGVATGVLTKSDLVRHLARPNQAAACAATLMSSAVISCRPDHDLHTVWQSMTARSLQNIPVLDATHKPVGVLDIRDAMKVLLEAEELQGHLLADYIAGVGYR